MSTSDRKGSRGFVLYFPIPDEPSAPVDKGVCYSKVTLASINNDDEDDQNEASPLIDLDVKEPVPPACTSVVAQSWTPRGSAVERRTSWAPIEIPTTWIGASDLESLFEPNTTPRRTSCAPVEKPAGWASATDLESLIDPGSTPKRTAGIKIGVTALVEDDSTKVDVPQSRTTDRKRVNNRRKSAGEPRSIPKSPLGRIPPRCSLSATDKE